MKGRDISPDNIHPNDRGHQIVSELISAYLEDVYNRINTISLEAATFDYPAITKEVYMEASILNSKVLEPDKWGSFEENNVNARFPGNWSTKKGDESILFTVEAANIGLMYQMFVNGTGGQYEVYVDGEYIMTLDADFSGGWGEYGETREVFVSNETRRRTLEIRKKDGSTRNAFSILGLLIS